MPRQLPIAYSLEARGDLRDIRAYIAKDNPAAARRVLAQIDREIELLRCFPNNSRKTDEPGVLARTLSRYPYIVFYKLEGGFLVVLHVLHAARRHPGFQEEQRAFAGA